MKTVVPKKITKKKKGISARAYSSVCVLVTAKKLTRAGILNRMDSGHRSEPRNSRAKYEVRALLPKLEIYLCG